MAELVIPKWLSQESMCDAPNNGTQIKNQLNLRITQDGWAGRVSEHNRTQLLW